MGRLITPEPNSEDGGETPPGHGRVVVIRRDGSQQRSLFPTREQALEVMLQAAAEPYNEKVICNYKAKDESYIDSYKFEQRRYPKQGPGILLRIWDKLLGVPVPDETPSREKIADAATEDLIRHHHQVACDLFHRIVPKDHPVDKHQYLYTILRPFVGKFIDANRDFFFDVKFTSADVVARLLTPADTLHLHDQAAAPALAQVERMTAVGTKARPEDMGPPGDNYETFAEITHRTHGDEHPCLITPADKTSTTPSPG